MSARRLRNQCLAGAVVAIALVVVSATVGPKQMVGPWLVAAWLLLNLAMAFHLEVDR